MSKRRKAINTRRNTSRKRKASAKQREMSSHRDPVSCLNMDVLSLIFSQLPFADLSACEKVSKGWNDAVREWYIQSPRAAQQKYNAWLERYAEPDGDLYVPWKPVYRVCQFIYFNRQPEMGCYVTLIAKYIESNTFADLVGPWWKRVNRAVDMGPPAAEEEEFVCTCAAPGFRLEVHVAWVFVRGYLRCEEDGSESVQETETPA